MSYQRQWLDTDATGDCQGQAVRALAEVLGSSLPQDYRTLAHELIDGALPTLAELRSLRAQAYVILACGHLWAERGQEGMNMEGFHKVARLAAHHLVECYQRSNRPGWRWFESRMTYANAVLPHALFVAARCWPKEGFFEVARESFAFLEEQTNAGRGSEGDVVFWPVGNNGWYSHGEAKAEYDQQPVEAVTMAEAALAGFDVTGDEHYLATLRDTHGWFHGQNSMSMALADARSGACCDGLQLSGVNRNQGAESTLAYLWTEVHLREGQHRHSAAPPQPTADNAHR